MVSNFTLLTAREITYNNFEIPLVVFMPNITTNHAITYTKNSSCGVVHELPQCGECALSASFVKECSDVSYVAGEGRKLLL